jgi:thiamine biosynthesis lipoprotein
MDHASAEWPVWSTTARVVVTEPAALDEARRLVSGRLSAVDVAASRFRDDSEISRLAAGGGRPRRVSPLLAELVGVALAAAASTDGDVDPTLGGPLAALGYDRDIALIPVDRGEPTGRRQPPDLFPHPSHGRTADGGTHDAPITRDASTHHDDATCPDDPRHPGPAATVDTLVVRPVPDWRNITLEGDVLGVPPGVVLDLGATAKAHTADRCAALVAERLGTGVLVSLGGDLATAGAAPRGGWRVQVQDRPGEPAGSVRLAAGGALATSSMIGRRWRRDGRVLHHVLDPRTCRPAPVVWRTVTVAATTCLAANTASTASLVRGQRAVGWLGTLGLPARLVDARGDVITVNGWPQDDPTPSDWLRTGAPAVAGRAGAGR